MLDYILMGFWCASHSLSNVLGLKGYRFSEAFTQYSIFLTVQYIHKILLLPPELKIWIEKFLHVLIITKTREGVSSPGPIKRAFFAKKIEVFEY